MPSSTRSVTTAKVREPSVGRAHGVGVVVVPRVTVQATVVVRASTVTVHVARPLGAAVGAVTVGAAGRESRT